MSASLLQFPTPAQASSAPADGLERSAALDPERSFLVEAPAGSGKTGLLVQRLLTLLCRVERPESVLALTFTNKATAEMRQRVLKALDMAQRDPATLSEFDRTTHRLASALLQHDRAHGWDLQANSYLLNIRTIDSLCGEIARSLPLSSGAVGQMAPVEDARPLYQRAARAVTLRLGNDDVTLNAALRNVLLHRDADLPNCESLLAEMLATREQWGRLIPLSPEELTDEYLDQKVKPRLDRALETVICTALSSLHQVFPADLLHDLTGLAVQLSSADGYREALNPLARCGDFHSAPGTRAADVEHWSLLARLLLNASSPFSWRKSMAINHLGFAITAAQKKRLQDLIERLSTNDALHRQLCNLSNLPPASMPPEDWRMTKSLFHLLHSALLELRVIFRETNTCDFTERSLAAHAALNSSDAEAQDLLLERLGLQHLLVDEMQDTSSAQYELLASLTRGWDGLSRTVFLVGDPKQSIYLFRQARVERFLGSMTTGMLGAVPLTTLRLTTNFRSAAPLVAAFNQIFEPIFQSSGEGEIRYTAATAARSEEHGDLRWHIDALWGKHGSDERRTSRRTVQREQAEHIVHTIHRLRSEAPEGQAPSFAVLVRAREHAAPITRLFRECGILFRGVDLEALNERPEVLDSLALTRTLLHPADRVAWLAVLRAPWCGATLETLYQLAGADTTDRNTVAPRSLFRERASLLPPAARDRVLRTLNVLDAASGAIGRMPLAEVVERTGRALGADSFRSTAERDNVQRFLELLEAAEAELQPLDAADLQARLSRLYAEPDTTPGAVDIMTIHKAKGLEWDVVFVPELQRSSGRSGQRLLDWLEVPASGVESEGGSRGSAGVLLAPIPPRGLKAAELPCYVQTARRRQEQAELTRLFYVAVTRARREVHLYAAPALKIDSGELSHPAGTLLHTAWPAVEAIALEAVQHQHRQEDIAGVVRASAAGDERGSRDLADLRRVPDGFNPGQLREPLVLPWLHARSAETPQAAEPAQELEAVARPEGSLSSRSLGTAVHLLLDQLAAEIATQPNKTPIGWIDDVRCWRGRIRATLRSLGVAGGTLERAVETVLLAMRNTLQSAFGFWLLQPHAHATSEQALLARNSDEQPARTLRMDRSFIAGPEPGTPRTGFQAETLWIVEYKTATAGGTPLPEFLVKQREKYAPQLRNYAQLLTGIEQAERPIMLALFYPLLPAFDFWPLHRNQGS